MSEKPHRRLTLTQPPGEANGNTQTVPREEAATPPNGGTATPEAVAPAELLQPVSSLLGGAREAGPAFLVVPLNRGEGTVATALAPHPVAQPLAAPAPAPRTAPSPFYYFVAGVAVAAVALLGATLIHPGPSHAARVAAAAPAPAAPSDLVTADPSGLQLGPDHALTHGLNIHKGANDIGYWNGADSSVSWNVETARAGKYAVELTYACGKGNGGRYAVLAGRQKLVSRAYNTGGWDQYRTRRIGKLNLPAGRFTLEVRPAGPIASGLMSLKAVRLLPLP